MVEADSANGAAPANYRLLLRVVIFLGVLIILAAGILVAGLILGWGRDRAASPAAAATSEAYLTRLPAPATGRISDASLEGGLLAVRIDGGETGSAVVVIDAETGEVMGRVELERAP